MTDITVQDRSAYEWAQMAADNNADPSDAPWRIVARHYLATVEAPATTLAEAIEAWAEKHYSGFVGTGKYEILALATLAEQIEEERDEARKRATANLRAVDAVRAQRDESRAEANALAEDLAGAESEVERLTAENENLRRTDNYREFRDKFLTVQKDAESNAETPDPADVKPGEPWIIRVGEREAVANRDGTSDWWTWSVSFFEGGSDNVADKNVTLVSRLVSAPRIITNPDELDQAKRRTVIRDTDGIVCERAPLGDGWFVPGIRIDQTPCIKLPATVLWEPEA